MICRKCKKEAPDGAFCIFCGTKQEKPKNDPKKRGNGQGTVFKLSNGKYRAEQVLGYYADENGKMHKRTRAKVFDKKSDAVAALPSLKFSSATKKKEKITFKQLYDKWFPTHRAGKSTMDCYKSAMKHFKPIWNMQMDEIDIDDLQECLDTCGKGKRTQENMKAMCGLVYKYGIPRNCTPNNLNLAEKLNSKLDSRLTRGISKKTGRGVNGVYNQDLNSNSVLLEVGGVDNTIEEVNNTLKIIARVIFEYLSEG